ncbi:MAG: hypothetical protein KGH89_01745 [Thaumarchaeota archaeon]|nr:hypothetical protein [Nitrososphaerota archaeon]MDE1866529.1 hypothetical protein [Nitrososphaerota archaeon]
MPSQGYATIGLKPAIISKLQNATDEYYPGMFLPSALIIMMNEIKREYYAVGMHNIKIDFSGRYTSLTVRSDVKEWFEENYKILKEKYEKKYRANNFTKFASIFMLNMFESKAVSRDNIINLKEADFTWLKSEYDQRKKEYETKHGVKTFEHFADVFLKDLLERINSAKKMLTL